MTASGEMWLACWVAVFAAANNAWTQTQARFAEKSWFTGVRIKVDVGFRQNCFFSHFDNSTGLQPSTSNSGAARGAKGELWNLALQPKCNTQIRIELDELHRQILGHAKTLREQPNENTHAWPIKCHSLEQQFSFLVLASCSLEARACSFLPKSPPNRFIDLHRIGGSLLSRREESPFLG